MGNVVPFSRRPKLTEPVTHIDGFTVRTYRVLIRDPDSGAERHEDWVALEDLSAVEMCQDALDDDSEEFGTPREVAVSAVDIGPGEL